MAGIYVDRTKKFEEVAKVAYGMATISLIFFTLVSWNNKEHMSNQHQRLLLEQWNINKTVNAKEVSRKDLSRFGRGSDIFSETRRKIPQIITLWW